MTLEVEVAFYHRWNMIFSRILFFCLLILLAHNSGYSKPLNSGKSKGHEADIYSVLPFERCSKISELILTIHNNIDYPIGYFKGLRDSPHQDFTWHQYGHRVFFHWGFNSNPRNSKILQQLVSERKWSLQVAQAFWDKVISEQARRNRETMSAVGKTLGFEVSGTQRTYANAFASIMTDIHILGDYSTTNTESLMDIDLVVADIKKALFESLKGSEDAKQINQKLDMTKTLENNKKRAEAIIAILISDLPEFILKTNNGFFRQHFKQQGLKIK